MGEVTAGIGAVYYPRPLVTSKAPQFKTRSRYETTASPAARESAKQHVKRYAESAAGQPFPIVCRHTTPDGR